jgi:hypothetical protein
MAEPFINRDDPSIPVLTEVIDVPYAPVPEPVPAPIPLIQQAVELPRTDIVDETVFADMRASLLKDLQQRVDPILSERMRVHVAAAVEWAMDEVAQKLRAEIALMLEEGLNKELIKRAALLDQQRRPRDPSSD